MNGLFGKIVGAINKDQTPGYALGEAVPSQDVAGVWNLHRATSRDTGQPALAFVFDPAAPTSMSAMPQGPPKADLAKAALSQIRRLKHPDVLRYITSTEHADGSIFFATEPATPLATLLSTPGSEKFVDRESLQWGLFTIARALGFLHQSGLIHGRLNAASVFVTPSGDWKLGGLEAVTSHASASALSRFVSIQPAAYQSPEFAAGNWSAVASAAPGAVDSWALGCLMYHAHNGSLSSADELRNTQPLPKQLLTGYQKLLASNPTARAPAAQIPNHPYFKSSKFIELNMFVENLALKGELEREAFLTKLPSLMDRLPDGFCTFKILPMLSESIESGRGAQPAFACVVKMKDRLSEADFALNVVKAHAVKWYGNAALDRQVRVEMYAKLDLFASHFDSADINGPVFSAMNAAFQDAQAPALRDGAVKAVVSIAPMLTEKNLNSVLMGHFARLQVDPEPAIRTNTTVCLGRLAPRLNQSTRNKVLLAAFLRTLKDPFPPARSAGANAILQTSNMYAVKDVATRLFPAVSPLLVDGSTEVRNLGFRILSTFQPALEKNHAEMTRQGEASAANATADGNAQARGGNATASGSGSSWGLGSFSSMTAALLTSKGDAAKPTNRAASGGISSDDFKAMNASSSTPSGNVNVSSSQSTTSSAASVSGSGSAPAPPAAFATNALTLNAAGAGGSGDAFGDFQSANGLGGGEGGGGANLADDDDDDEDGWGDMNIRVGEDDAGGADEDDILSMLGPPPRAPPRKQSPGGVSANGAAAKDAGDPWALASTSTRAPAKPTMLTPALGTTGAGSAQAPSRRTAKKASGGDDWEALLSGSGGGSTRRKGLGATRR